MTTAGCGAPSYSQTILAVREQAVRPAVAGLCEIVLRLYLTAPRAELARSIDTFPALLVPRRRKADAIAENLALPAPPRFESTTTSHVCSLALMTRSLP